MLTGSFFNSVDEKGRAFVPTKLRYSLGERIWLVKGLDVCLYVYTPDAFAAFTEEYVTNRTLEDPNARKFQRFILGGSREIEIDKQGRINIPQDHMDYAGIDKDVVFVGCGDRIELWGAELYAKEMAPGNLDPDEMMRGKARAATEEE